MLGFQPKLIVIGGLKNGQGQFSTYKMEVSNYMVIVPKYKRRTVYGKLREDIGEILRKLCNNKYVEIIEVPAMPDLQSYQKRYGNKHNFYWQAMSEHQAEIPATSTQDLSNVVTVVLVSPAKYADGSDMNMSATAIADMAEKIVLRMKSARRCWTNLSKRLLEIKKIAHENFENADKNLKKWTTNKPSAEKKIADFKA